MYDLDGDSRISQQELLAVLHMMVGANISEDQVQVFSSPSHPSVFLHLMHTWKLVWNTWLMWHMYMLTHND